MIKQFIIIFDFFRNSIRSLKSTKANFRRSLLWVLAVSSTLSAAQGSFEEEFDVCSSRPLIEIKAGYFNFTNSTLRKVYNRGGLDVQLCASYPFWNLNNSRWSLHAYAAMEYFQRSGKSLNTHQHTSLWALPINIGLKPVYTINDCLSYYFGIGPRYFYLHQHNRSSYIYKNRSRNGTGFFINTGIYYKLCNQFILDVFGEYSYGKIRFRGGNSRVYTKRIQFGGFTFGGGLGYEF